MHYEEKKKHINNSTPLVSIITPLYNAQLFISETILSIQNQTYPHWELIIVDDNSSDNSVALSEKFAREDERIQLVKLKSNKGAAYCRNHATQLAKGDFIAFLDADDLWHPEKLSKQLDFMKTHGCDVSLTNYLLIDEKGDSLKKRVKALSLVSYKKQHSNNYIGNLTGMYNVKQLGKILAPNIRKRQDWAVWLEAIKKSGKPAKGLQEDLAYYRVHNNSMSANKTRLIKYNYSFYKDYLGYSNVVSVYYLLRFFYEYFFIRTKQIEKL